MGSARVAMLTRRPLEIAGVGAHFGESTSRVAAAGYHLEVLVTDWSGQLLRRQAPEGNLIRRLAAYLRSRDWSFRVRPFVAAILRRRLLGSGPCEPELLALAKRLGVSDKVSIRFLPPPDRALRGEKVAAALTPPLERPLVPDRELLPTRETSAAGILDAYRSVLRP